MKVSNFKQQYLDDMDSSMTAKKKFKKIPSLVFAVIITIILIGPLCWLLMLSFKTQQEIIFQPLSLPHSWSFRNYFEVLRMPDYLNYYWNSIKVVFISLVASIIISAWAGYGFSRFDFKGKKLIFNMIFCAVMVPGQILIIPISLQMNIYGLNNSLLGLSLIYIAFSLPVSIFILRAFFARIPQEISDAGNIDGANEWVLFWRIMFPIARPAVVTVSIFNFVNMWNEFTYAVVLLQSESHRTLPLGIFKFVGENLSNYSYAAASLVLSILPVLIWYVIFSERVVEGMTSGSVKG